jgi:aminomethyltransferase
VPIQALFALYVNYSMVTKDQLQVVAGKITPDEYRRATTAFAEPAAWINEHPSQRVALYDEVFAAGEQFGIQAFSAAALMMCRVEAGMVMGEIEYDHTVSPYECRLGWTIDDKPHFHGRDALLARKATDNGRVVTISVEGEPDGLDGSVVHAGEAPLGIVTMAVPSPVLGGQTIALARIHRDYANVDTELAVATPDGLRTATVIATPVFDPQRIRVRS